MSLPDVDPQKSLAGISLDPITLERVIPESRRPDGSVRKQIKIRPGFTPQEDVRRFRGTKQAQMDANALPKGHIIGWVPPPGATKPDVSGANRPSTASSSTPTTKAAKKNAKRKEKREREKSDKAKEEVPDNWEDDEEQVDAKKIPSDENVDSGAECLSSQLEKLDVK